mmetsp:Transcript_2440/g.6372  ORF Transcript_2440/g.6372 Transcript_2440/m.6372 type:complete len:149 (-) Transcript_2440:2070-2516(-)
MQSASAWWMDHHSRTNNKIKADLEPPCHCAGEPYKRPHVLEIRGINMDGIAVGLSKGHVVSKRKLAARPSQRKGKLGKRVKVIRDLIRDVVGSAPYEKRLMELLKVGRDKRALKLAKRKLGTHLRGKKKREEMGNLLRKMSRKAAPHA